MTIIRPHAYGIALLAAGLACMPGARSALAQARVPVAPGIGQLGVHVVQPGESLYGLAVRYDMPAADLARLNATGDAPLLLPGRTVWVPLSRAHNVRAGAPAARTAARGRTAASGDATYVIAAGDTLYAIAGRLGVDVEDLKRWNGLPVDGSIRAGDTLVVQRDAPEDSASRAGERGRDAAATDRRPAGTGGAGTTRTHTVAAGETLSSIAAAYGVSANELSRLNALADADTLRPGQDLAVPAPGAGPAAATGDKRIEIDVSEQRMYVWQGETLVWNFVVSTGLPGYPTRRGTFEVQSRIPNAWSTAWQLWMPHWLGIYWAGGSENGIHALPIVNGQRLWGGYLGSPISYGCVVLGTEDAELLYEWADIGTPVVIRD